MNVLRNAIFKFFYFIKDLFKKEDELIKKHFANLGLLIMKNQLP